MTDLQIVRSLADAMEPRGAVDIFESRAWKTALEDARHSDHPLIKGLVEHYEGYDGVIDSPWPRIWWQLLEDAEWELDQGTCKHAVQGPCPHCDPEG